MTMPAQEPQLRYVDSGGVQVAAWDWPAASSTKRRAILFAHATGFHGRAWDEVIRQFPERRRIAVEVRGHGRSEKTAPPYSWRDFGRDIAAVAEALEVTEALGVGHSMGGHSTVCAAAFRPGTYARLLLIDPTIFPPEAYGTAPPDAGYIAKRKNIFQSPEEMIERYRERLPFSRWHPQVLRDYCEFGIVSSGDHYVLACPPDIEASIYHQSKVSGSNIYPEIARIEQPVGVIRAGNARRPGVFDLSTSPTAENLASYFQHGTDQVFEDCSHYIPQEAPGRVAEQIALLLVE
jgi:pimeloyl-ACP methyl ester carboxylesterase